MTDSPSHPEPQSEQQPEPQHSKSHPDSGSSRVSGDMDGLVSRLQVIEDQPLTQRAPAYVQLYDELRAVLEGADASA